MESLTPRRQLPETFDAIPSQLSAASDATPDGNNLKRKRQPRNSACQPCASLKMKCVTSAVPGKCERCHRMNRDCIHSIPKPRKRRNQDGLDSPAGVPVASLLDNGPVSTPNRSLPPPLGYQDSTPKTSLLPRDDLRHAGSHAYASSFAKGLNLDDTSLDLLDGVDYNTVQSSLTIFRQLTRSFPFVALSPNADAVNIANTRPMLTLAICLVTAGAYRNVQERLAQAFRLALASKVIMEGQRSLDLLMGMLVYLAWHHHYMAKQQIYQELCLLAGMATDLGIYQLSPKADTGDNDIGVERDRAFLGCYYICCSLSIMGFNKPNPLRWTENFRRCAENVTLSRVQQSDRMLIAIVELIHTIEEIEDALRLEANMKRSTFAHYVDMHTKSTISRLKTLRREHPELGGTLLLTATTIHFQHRMLRAIDVPDTSTLVLCACAIKEYLDDVLARPPMTLYQVAIVDWTSLLEILVLMARISKPLPQAAGWEAGALSSMLQPDAMLEAICNHMASAASGDPHAPRNEVLLQWVRGVCDSIKRRILRERIASGASTSTLRNDESQYDTLHSLGQPELGAGAESRFRPLNESRPAPLHANQDAQLSGSNLDGFNFFGNGVLDEGFWVNFMDGV